MNNDIECNVYAGRDDEKKIIYIEKIVLKADDKRVGIYENGYRNIQTFAQQHGYVIVDVNMMVDDSGYARTIGDPRRRVSGDKAFYNSMPSGVKYQNDQMYQEIPDEYEEKSESMQGRSR